MMVGGIGLPTADATPCASVGFDSETSFGGGDGSGAGRGGGRVAGCCAWSAAGGGGEPVDRAEAAGTAQQLSPGKPLPAT